MAIPGLYRFVQKEARSVGQLRNIWLANSLGYRCKGDERLLVAEYMPNDTLVKHLFHYKELDIIEMALYGDVLRSGKECRCRIVAKMLGHVKEKDRTDACKFST